MLATFLEVLDTSVANVALPHIAGNLSASTDEATWVLTSYLVSNAIVLPMTGWLSSFFGRKRFLIGCIVLFTLASAACGLATELGFLVLPGFCKGRPAGPCSPFAGDSHGKFSTRQARRGDGHLQPGRGRGPDRRPGAGRLDHGRLLLALDLLHQRARRHRGDADVAGFLEDPPYLRAAHERRGGQIDYIGFGVMAIWLASLQIILDRGQQDDWFNAAWIRWGSRHLGGCRWWASSFGNCGRRIPW